jgi:hypothetical protein
MAVAGWSAYDVVTLWRLRVGCTRLVVLFRMAGHQNNIFDWLPDIEYIFPANQNLENLENPANLPMVNQHLPNHVLETELMTWLPHFLDRAEYILQQIRQPVFDDTLLAFSVLKSYSQLDSQTVHAARFAALSVLAASQECDFFAEAYQLLVLDQSIDLAKLSVAKFCNHVDQTLVGDPNLHLVVMQQITDFLANHLI